MWLQSQTYTGNRSLYKAIYKAWGLLQVNETIKENTIFPNQLQLNQILMLQLAPPQVGAWMSNMPNLCTKLRRVVLPKALVNKSTI